MAREGYTHFQICTERDRDFGGDLETVWDGWPVLDATLEQARERYQAIKGDEFFANGPHIYISENTPHGLQMQAHPIEVSKSTETI